MRKSLRRVGLSALALASCVELASAAGTLQGTGGDVSRNISGDGSTAVGWDGPDAATARAWKWTAADGKVLLPGVGPTLIMSRAAGVSYDGTVVSGEVRTTASGDVNAVVWTASDGPRLLGPGKAFAVSSNGAVAAGVAQTDGGATTGDAAKWLLPSGAAATRQVLTTGGFAFALGLNGDGSVAVGADEGIAVRWTGGGNAVELLGVLPGMASSRALNVSGDGLVVAGQSTQLSGFGGESEAFRWTAAGGMAGLGDLPGGGLDSYAWDMTADGSVLVGYGTTDAGRRAMIWDGGNGMRDLQEVMEGEWGVALDGWQLYDPSAGFGVFINDDGSVLTGTGINPRGEREAWVAVVPEPSSVLVVALGSLALLKRRRF